MPKKFEPETREHALRMLAETILGHRNVSAAARHVAGLHAAVTDDAHLTACLGMHDPRRPGRVLNCDRDVPVAVVRQVQAAGGPALDVRGRFALPMGADAVRLDPSLSQGDPN